MGLAHVSGDIPATSTVVSCAPDSIAVYQATTCTATVTGGSEAFSGMFFWSSSVGGSFSTASPCPFADTCLVTSVAPATTPSGYCSVTFIPIASPASGGQVTMTAIYEYDEDHGSSEDTTQVTVTPASAPPSDVTVVTATITQTTTAVTTTTLKTGPAFSVLGVSGLIVLVGILMVLTLIAGGWRREPTPAQAREEPT